jgi:hypothetical protein
MSGNKVIRQLDLLREVYSRQAEEPEYAREREMKMMIEEKALDILEHTKGSGLDDIVGNNPYVMFTVNNVRHFTDSELYTRLKTIDDTLVSQIAKMVPSFFQYETGVFIVNQSPNGDIISSKWWEGGTVTFRPL